VIERNPMYAIIIASEVRREPPSQDTLIPVTAREYGSIGEVSERAAVVLAATSEPETASMVVMIANTFEALRDPGRRAVEAMLGPGFHVEVVEPLTETIGQGRD
jgi:hypothetical protein